MKLVVALGVLLYAWSALAAPTDRQVDEVAAQLRCVVCQNLSVADSPSDMAKQMRDLVRERLAAGETPEQVKAYFVERYGEWVLLSPPARGFSLLAWVAPLGALGGGAVLALVVLYRWTKRGATTMTDDDDVDAESLAAVRREIERRSGA